MMSKSWDEVKNINAKKQLMQDWVEGNEMLPMLECFAV